MIPGGRRWLSGVYKQSSQSAGRDVFSLLTGFFPWSLSLAFAFCTAPGLGGSTPITRPPHDREAHRNSNRAHMRAYLISLVLLVLCTWQISLTLIRRYRLEVASEGTA
jgi:phosphoglycerol transferase MdoB-like AlkP superfamily enzyme